MHLTCRSSGGVVWCQQGRGNDCMLTTRPFSEKVYFPVAPAVGREVFEPRASAHKGQECPQELRTLEKFILGGRERKRRSKKNKEFLAKARSKENYTILAEIITKAKALFSAYLLCYFLL